MQLRRAAVLSIPLVLWLGGPASAQEAPGPETDDLVVLAGAVTIARGDVVDEVVVFTGRVSVQGVVRGDVVVLDGPVTVTGQVDGSVIAADGVVRLAGARASAATSSRAERSDPPPARASAARSVAEVRFSLEAPLATLGELLGPVAIAISVLLVGLLLLLLAPRGLDVVAETLSDAPLASIGWGLLLSLAAPITAIALGVSVLGLPLGLAFLLSLGLWWLLGLASATWCVGRALVRPAPRPPERLPRGMGDRRRGRAGARVERRRLDPGGAARDRAIVVAAWRVRHHGHRGGRHRPGVRPSAEDEVAAGRTRVGAPRTGAASTPAIIASAPLAGGTAPLQHDRDDQRERERNGAAARGRHRRDLGSQDAPDGAEHVDRPRRRAGVETNDEMIVLSRLRLNASSPPARTAGIISGSVTSLERLVGGVAERSADASSSDSSSPARRPHDQRDHGGGEQRVADEQPQQQKPFSNGPPIRTYQISSEIASTISGVTITRNTNARNAIVHLPGRRASAMAAHVPSTVERGAAPTARIECHTDAGSCGSRSRRRRRTRTRATAGARAPLLNEYQTINGDRQEQEHVDDDAPDGERLFTTSNRERGRRGRGRCSRRLRRDLDAGAGRSCGSQPDDPEDTEAKDRSSPDHDRHRRPQGPVLRDEEPAGHQCCRPCCPWRRPAPPR